MNTISKSITLFNYLTIFGLLLLIMSCGSGNSKKKQLESITNLEKILFDDDGNINPSSKRRTEMEQLRTEYRTFIQDFSSDTSSARYLYNWAMLEADFFKRYDESAHLLERFQREYNTHPFAAKALFLQGFTYSEYLKDYKKAELAYQAFVQKYPDHEMIPSIQFELQNLGKSPEELLQLKLKSTND